MTVLHAEHSQRRGRHCIGLMPFYAATQARWNYHTASKRDVDPVTRKARYDCTHFCYSPSFWDGSLDGLARKLRFLEIRAAGDSTAYCGTASGWTEPVASSWLEQTVKA